VSAAYATIARQTLFNSKRATTGKNPKKSMSALVLLTLNKSTTGPLEKSFGEFCRSTALSATCYQP